jgi:PAS domain S-box-containing protein
MIFIITLVCIKTIQLEPTSLFEIAFNRASEGLLVVNDEGVVIQVNQRMSELFLYERDEMIGQTMELFVPKDLRASHVGLRDTYLDKPRSRSMGKTGVELRGQRKNGSVFPVEVSLNYFIKDGKKYVLGLVTDISERKIIEDELRAAQENLSQLNEELEMLVIKRTAQLEKSQLLYEMIAKNFPDGVINVLDENFNYIFSEGKELSRFGIGSADLLGTSYLNRLEASIRGKIEDLLNKVKAGENQTSIIELKNNHYELNIVGIKDDGNRVERILIVEINVSKKIKLEMEQLQALEKEKSLGEMKSRFVSMASHEFRTPLGAILSSASLIEKYTTTEQQENRLKHTSRIKSSVGNLTGILNDFLSFDKLSSDAVAADISEVDICGIVQYAIEELQSLKKLNQQIVFQPLSEDECMFKTDEKIIKNILLNLLSNGLKYSGDDGKVVVRIENNKEFMSITVSDNGIGIPATEQERLFERFFRAENVSNIQGTGLGLNIVKKYLEILEGEITFQSEENVGTTFNVKLPIRN